MELRGIEPLTFSMRTRRATNCAIAPRHPRRRRCRPLEQRGKAYQYARPVNQTGSRPGDHSPAVWVCIRIPSSLKMLIICAGRAPAAERLCGTRVSNSAASPRTKISS